MENEVVVAVIGEACSSVNLKIPSFFYDCSFFVRLYSYGVCRLDFSSSFELILIVSSAFSRVFG